MGDQQQRETQNSFFLGDERDVEKLNRETLYLTDNDNFFPELVWKKIVGKLVATKDIESCSNSSPYFQKLLYKKRQDKICLPKVFQKLYPYLLEAKRDDDDDDDDDDDIDDIANGLAGLAIVPEEDENDNDGNIAQGHPHQIQNVQHIPPQIQDRQESSLAQLWNCRLVSKTWNSCIDSMFTDKEAGHYTVKYDMGNCRNLQLDTWANDRFHVFERPQSFNAYFNRTHYDPLRNILKKNPFLGRSAQFLHFHVIHTMPFEFQQYAQGILELLTKYGSELWYVFFDVHNGLLRNDPVTFYNMLRQIINLMPNLKVLRIMYTEDFQNVEGGLDINVIRMVGLHQLEQAVQQNPLATLPNLEFLGTVNLPTPIFNELLQRNMHVSMLQADRQDFHGYYRVFMEPFASLKTLNLQFCSVEDFQQLENYQHQFDLERFYFWYDNSAQFIPWSRVLNTLNSKLGKRCTELLLQMPVPKTKDQRKQVLKDSHRCRLNFPKLEKLTIFDDASFSLDLFLETRASLKLITLRYSNDDNKDAVAQHLKNQRLAVCSQFIEFVGFKDNLERSNIWREFPKLKHVTFQRSREMGGCVMYKCFRENKWKLGVNKRKWYRETGDERVE